MGSPSVFNTLQALAWFIFHAKPYFRHAAAESKTWLFKDCRSPAQGKDNVAFMDDAIVICYHEWNPFDLESL